MLKQFLEYAKAHRITIRSRTRIIGIKAILVGWALIALMSSVFAETHSSVPITMKYWIIFASGAVALLTTGLCKQFNYFSILKSKIDQTDKGHLSPRHRLKLIWIRGFAATGGVMLFLESRILIGVLDNSALFGVDALIYAILMAVVLRERVGVLRWIGVAIASSGVVWVFFIDIAEVSLALALAGVVCGLLSSGALALVTLMSSPMVQHDPPLRIAFYQCLSGLILCTLLAIPYLVADPHLLFQLDLTVINLVECVGMGILYAIALIYFLEAFLYTEPIIIATLSYSLVPLTIAFNFIIAHTLPTSEDLIVSSLFMLGCGLLIYHEYKIGENEPTRTYAPVYHQSLKEDFRLLKENYRLGEIDQYEYMSARHEYNKLLFEYKSELSSTDIESIDISSKHLLFNIKNSDLKIESDGSCRSAPLEMLNFGTYESAELQMIYKCVSDGDIVFDIGAHIGWHTINIARKFPTSVVHSFEPIPITYSYLQKNIRHNDLQNVRAYNLGLYDENRKMLFHYFQGGSALASPKNLIDISGERVECTVQKLDVFAESHNIRRVDFIKIDAEGCEFAVLKGGRNLIKRHSPVIMMELVGAWAEKFGYSLDEVFELMKSLGYDCFAIKDESLFPTNSVDENRYNYFFLSRSKHSELIEANCNA